MMTLREAWKDSLQSCKPQAVKLMLLVTFNAMRHVIRALWAPWFLVPLGVLTLLSLILNSVAVGHTVYVFSVVSLFLAVRPSLQIKNSTYFRTYFLKIFSFFVELIAWAICITALLVAWEFLLVPFGHVHSLLATEHSFHFKVVNYIATMPARCVEIMGYIAYVFHIIYYVAFFYLDKAGTVFVSCKKACKLLYYNLPMILLYTGILWAVKILVQGGAHSLLVLFLTLDALYMPVYGTVLGIGRFVVNLFIFCLISNIYTKRVHDQYSLYQ